MQTDRHSQTKKLKVMQQPDKEVPTEVLAQAIVDIADGIKRLRAGRLNEKALTLLIQHAAPTKNRSGQRYGLSEISDILDGIESLERTYVRKK